MVAHTDNKVLVVDDSPIYRHLISGRLREWGFEVLVANDGAEAWKTIQRPGSPCLVITDWVMPRMDGIELCQKVREMTSPDGYVYIILLTSKDEKSDLVKAMDDGADDYLAKPFDEQELRVRLKVGQRILGVQRELIAAREALRRAATYDGLTELLNRSEIIETLRRELVRSQREKKPVTLMLADIDRFKAVNDEMGHQAGDSVLKEVARRLRNGARTYDSIGRYGGEEFLLLLPGCDLIAAFNRADQFRKLISAESITTAKGCRTVTMSVGIAVAEPDRQVDVQMLIQEADAGLYRAKRNGRNRVEYIDKPERANQAQAITT
jgi:two-component system cell cycle response regulator